MKGKEKVLLEKISRIEDRSSFLHNPCFSKVKSFGESAEVYLLSGDWIMKSCVHGVCNRGCVEKLEVLGSERVPHCQGRCGKKVILNK